MASVTKRGNRYRIRVSAGYDVEGNQIIKSKTWTPDSGMTKRQIVKELERQKVLFEDEVNAGIHTAGTIKFQTFAEQWFQDYASSHLRKKLMTNIKNTLSVFIRRSDTYA